MKSNKMTAKLRAKAMSNRNMNEKVLAAAERLDTVRLFLNQPKSVSSYKMRGK